MIMKSPPPPFSQVNFMGGGHLLEMCSVSEAGSYLRLIDFVYHSTLGLRVMKKKQRRRRGHLLALGAFELVAERDQRERLDALAVDRVDHVLVRCFGFVNFSSSSVLLSRLELSDTQSV